MTGERIKKLRKEKGLTQQQLGEMLGVQKSAIAKYEILRIYAIGSRLCGIIGIV